MLLLALAAFTVLPVTDGSGQAAAERTAEWTFRARVTDCRVAALDDDARRGVVYTKAAIKNAKNGATLIVGVDAQWLVTLAILDHGNNRLGFKQIKTLKLVIHSPAISLGVDEPKNRQFDLALSYRVNDRSGYTFVLLQTRQPGKSK